MNPTLASELLPQLEFANRTADEVVELMSRLQEMVPMEEDPSIYFHAEAIRGSAYTLGLLLALLRGEVAVEIRDGERVPDSE